MADFQLPTLQLVLRPGIIELGWGHPPLELLPVDAIQHAAGAALARYGAEALTYGYMGGPGPLINWLQLYIGRQEGRTPAADEMLITGGNSHALDQILTLCTQPGDTVLVEAPTYHLAVRILRDHPLNLVAVPMDGEGLDIAALEQTLSTLEDQGIRPRLLYTIPTFHNPTGISLTLARRHALVDLAAAVDLLIVEDDVYRELAYDEPAPPSLWQIAPRGGVLRMGSFSKSLAPGLRLGWLTGDAHLIQRMATGGLLDSGGGVNHFVALVVAELCADGAFEQQAEKLRSAYRSRRDALLHGLAEYLPPGCTWQRPGGGFFAWVMLPAGIDGAALLPRAQAAGVAFLPGSTFFLDDRTVNTLRLAFSLYPPEELYEAAKRLALAVRKA